MSILADAIRPFWSKGLNDVDGVLSYKFSEWINEGKYYQIYNPIISTKFEINIINKDSFLRGIAFDCNRMSQASFESMNNILIIENFPKAKAWLIIKSYYSAFYAAHSILRFIGISLTQFDTEQSNSIDKVGKIYNPTNIKVEKGFYKCSFNDSLSILECEKLDKALGGSHEILWGIFLNVIKRLSNDVLTVGSSVNNQIVSGKLIDLIDNLTFLNHTKGSWLSKVRNDVNYKHNYGVWFPYKSHQKYYEQLYNLLNDWKKDPINIQLNIYTGKEMLRFFSTCSFIVSFCRTLVEDMSHRCSKGKSFHLNGSISYIKQVEQKNNDKKTSANIVQPP
jgi:hypothetical protein